tara:strand:+ start:222 stop:1052 length:831 start_codon:yes stop_codon:yes gene_type:complete
MLIDFILDPFQFSFMVRALIICICVGIICPFLGAHVINRQMGFMGDALAHSVMPGMVVSYIIGISPFFGAIPMGIVVALLIGFLVRKTKISNDTSIGIMFTGLFAIGLIMISLVGGLTVNLEDLLLGQVTSTSVSDLYTTLFLTTFVLVVMCLLYKQMIFTGFDYEGATVIGLKAGMIDYILLGLLSIVIIVTLQAVGIILVVGMLITPAAAASLITNRFWKLVIVGIIFGVISAIGGLYASYYLDLPSGPSIAMISTIIFCGSFAKKQLRWPKFN